MDLQHTLRSCTQSVILEGNLCKAYEFLSNPANLPKWAVGFARDIRQDGDRWIVQTANGELPVRYVCDAELGVIDFHVSVAPGVTAPAFSRLIPNGSGAEYVFTMIASPDMSDDVFEAQVRSLREELQVLRHAIAAYSNCPA